ncbi:MAG TPA: DUF1080 domain-containing protein [Planctomycetes bacterium]|nr:DUF1080 domain-containing protein [Planctomycetaceae bacterium]HIM30476.1 DUF1080 domain-containing protein [Planctomycetota bacterium]
MRHYANINTVIRLFLLMTVAAFVSPSNVVSDEPDLAIVPQKTIRPFNGKNLSGFTTWLQTTEREDPNSDYTAKNGMIRVGGKGMGYLATVDSYRDYHLSVEYKWGTRTDGSKYVRNSGILLHAVGPAGNAKGIWMASIECQLAQGCEGDLIVIRGTDQAGKVIPASITSDTTVAADGRTRWKLGGQKTVYAGKQFWWSKHQTGFKELLDTRGRDDVASKLGQWTKVECICDGTRITIKINGKTVNECYDVFPTAGRILLENEMNEIYFRNFEIRPLTPKRAK